MLSSAPHFRSGPHYAGLRIGILGGSFNPAHAGHRAVSLYALKRLNLHCVWWLVSPQNPLKSHKDMAPLSQRMAEARKTARHPRIIVTALEQELRTRFTADTLKMLKRRFSRAHFVWLMGTDNLQQIHRWYHWQDVFRLTPVAVFRRPAYAAGCGTGKAAERFGRDWISRANCRNLAVQKPPAWLVLDNPLYAYSATKIRKDQATWQRQKQK